MTRREIVLDSPQGAAPQGRRDHQIRAKVAPIRRSTENTTRQTSKASHWSIYLYARETRTENQYGNTVCAMSTERMAAKQTRSF